MKVGASITPGKGLSTLNLAVFMIMLLLISTACSVRDVEEPIESTATLKVETPTPKAEITSTITPNPPTATPTITLTATQPAILVSVSANTNCRTGPGTGYDQVGVLLVDEFAEVQGQSTIDDYWFIDNLDRPGEYCWLSGAYASVIGDTSDLPSFTPMPSPTPQVGFDLYLKGFESCGSTTFVVFSVRNGGAQLLKSAYVEIVDFETGEYLYGPARERFPFAPSVRPVCPPGHGNILPSGVVEFIHSPINPVPHGHRAIGTITLCTGDYQGGECATKVIYFSIP